MSYELVKLTADNHHEWDKFCQLSDEVWFWHTTGWLKYTANYRPELKTEDLSFMVKKQTKVLAIVPLTLEIISRGEKKYSEFSFGGAAIPAPALVNGLERIEKDRAEADLVRDLIHKEINRLAAEKKVRRARFRQTPLAPASFKEKNCFNHLIGQGYLDTSLTTRLIDLSKSEEFLYKDLRRNHRRNIKKAEIFTVKIFDQNNISQDIFTAYQSMHKKAAGRQTRPDITFDLMFAWLKQGLAMLAAVEHEHKFIGFEYYTLYKNKVYGFSAANDPDYEKDYPIRHLLEWQAILWMKKNKFDYYEIGLQQFGNTLYDLPDKKQLDITHFKKGFGGFLAPWFMGEKFYDQEYFLAIYRERVKKYAEQQFK